MTAAKKLSTHAPSLEIGRVERAGGDRSPTCADAALFVRLGADVCSARRAKGCLVAPEIGDEVLCAVTARAVFVLCVLEGSEGSATKLVAEGDLEINAPNSRITVRASQGIRIEGGTELHMSGATMSVAAVEGAFAIEQLGFVGRLVRAEVRRITLLAHEVDEVMTSLRQRARRVFRFVEEIDQTRAGTIDVRAEGLASIRAENTVVSARVLTKLDGERVHIG